MHLAYNITDDDMFMNITCIHPIMQKTVKEFIDWCEPISTVEYIVIFGSATSTACHFGSDLDIYVVTAKHSDFYNFKSSTGIPLDIFVKGDIPKDSRLAKNIMDKGVLVFGRFLDKEC